MRIVAVAAKKAKPQLNSCGLAAKSRLSGQPCLIPPKINRYKYKFEFEGIRRRTEIKPSSFSDVYLRDEVIKRTYAYRSSFIHVGGNLPHREVEGSPLNRFLEEVYEPKKHKTFLEKLKKENRNEYSRKEALEFTNFLITYALMRTIARKSIFNYLEECTG